MRRAYGRLSSAALGWVSPIAVYNRIVQSTVSSMNIPPQSSDLQRALWANKARRLRKEAIPALSRILGFTVSSDDFTSSTEYRSLSYITGGPDFTEERFPLSERAGVIDSLASIATLGEPSQVLLSFCRSQDIGCLGIPKWPSPEEVADLVDWDRDDVYGFDLPTRELLFHVELCDDYLDAENQAGRQMLYIVNKLRS